MMAKPMKTLELHYPMMQFLIKLINCYVVLGCCKAGYDYQNYAGESLSGEPYCVFCAYIPDLTLC